MKSLILIFALILAAGKLSAQPYYYNSGDPTVLSNWGNQPGGTGTAPSVFGAFTEYIIENGKTAVVNSPWVFVPGGGTLRVNPGATLTANSPVTLQGCTFLLDSAATYIHNNTATAFNTVFFGTENFNQYSNVRIDNWSGISNSSIVNGVSYTSSFFGNLEINWTSCSGDWYQYLSGVNLCRELKITSTGSGRFLPGTTNNSSNFISVTDYYQTGGEVDLAFGSTVSNNYAVTLIILGKFNKTGGIIDANGSQSFGQIMFNKYSVNPVDTAFQTFFNSGTLRRVRLSTNPFNKVRLLSEMPLTTNSSYCGLNIQQLSVIDCGAHAVLGAGPITFGTGVTIKIGSPFGVKTGASQGNITTTGQVVFSSGDTLEYNGSAAQSLGDAVASPFPCALKINNISGVTLNATMRFASGIKFVSGKLNLGDFDLINTSSTIVSGGGQDCFFNTNGNGYYKEWISFGGVKDYYLGNGTFTPLRLIIPSVTPDTFSFKISNDFLNQPKDSSKCVRKRWSIVEATPGGVNAAVYTQWLQSDNGSNFNLNNGVMGRWSSYASKYIPSRGVLSYPFMPPAYPASVSFTANSPYFTSFSPGEDFIIGNEEGIYNQFFYEGGDASLLSSWKENSDGTGLNPVSFDDYAFFKVGFNKNAVFENPANFSSKSILRAYSNGQITSTSPVSCYGSFELLDSATYNHNNNTPAYYTVFGGTEYFSPNSTYNIQMWSDTAQKIYTGLNTIIGNLTINFNNLNGGFGAAQWKGNYPLSTMVCAGNLKYIQSSGYYFCPVGNGNVTASCIIGGNLQVGDSVLGTYPTLDLSGGSTIPSGQRGGVLTLRGNLDIQSGYITSQSYPVIAKGAISFYSNRKHTFYCYNSFLLNTMDIGDQYTPSGVAQNDTLVMKSDLYKCQNYALLNKDVWQIDGVLDLDTFSIKSLTLKISSAGKMIVRNKNGFYGDLSSIQNVTFDANATLEYAGTETQNFLKPGSYEITAPANLMINNPNNVIINIPGVTIHDNLNLVRGNLITDSVNYISFADTAGISNTIGSSINGPIRIITTSYKLWQVSLSNQNTSRDFILLANDNSEWKIQFFNSQQQYGNDLDAGLNSLCQNEYFLVERLSGTSTAVIGLGWGHNTGITDANNIKVAHWNGSLWEDKGNGGWSGTNDSGFVFSYSISNFSPFAIASTDGQPLPVELSSFSADVNKNNVTLNWTTEHELNNSGFEIQRKSNIDTNWKKINFIQGAGSSNTQKNYKYEDKNISTGKYRYRLKQTDHNGNFTYYNLQNELVVGVPQKFSLSQNYPNPFNPSTKINFELPNDSKVTMQIYDMTGRLITEVISNENFTAGYHTVQFNGSSLASGTYFYRISAGEFVQTKKMILVK